jgi:hypothetical protein
MARGLRIGSKAEVLKNLRALLRVTRKRSTEKSVRECQWSQQILTQVRAPDSSSSLRNGPARHDMKSSLTVQLVVS